jgi:hypothetical protein
VASGMANIKLTLEADISDEVMKKFIEILEKAEKPPEEIQVELSDLKGRMTIRLVEKKTE